MSRFESQLLVDVGKGAGRLEGQLASLAWAAYRARIGDFESAKQIVVRERSVQPSVYSAALYARINFVEGLCQYFECGPNAALEKLSRASALAIGCPEDDSLPSLIFSWLAGLHRNQGRWRAMVDSLLAAVERKSACTPEVYFRVCLVCADILQEVGFYEAASVWYAAARERALEIGDDAALSAMLYNRAAIRIFNARLDVASNVVESIEEGYIALQASSAQNYTHYIRDGSMKWGFDLMEGQLRMLHGDCEAALALLDSKGLTCLEAYWPSVDCVRQADIFRCRAQIRGLKDSFDENSIRILLDRVLSLPAAGDRAIALHSIIIGMRIRFEHLAPKVEGLLSDQLSLVVADRSQELNEFARFTHCHENPSTLL